MGEGSLIYGLQKSTKVMFCISRVISEADRRLVRAGLQADKERGSIKYKLK